MDADYFIKKLFLETAKNPSKSIEDVVEDILKQDSETRLASILPTTTSIN